MPWPPETRCPDHILSRWCVPLLCARPVFSATIAGHIRLTLTSIEFARQARMSLHATFGPNRPVSTCFLHDIVFSRPPHVVQATLRVTRKPPNRPCHTLFLSSPAQPLTRSLRNSKVSVFLCEADLSLQNDSSKGRPSQIMPSQV